MKSRCIPAFARAAVAATLAWRGMTGAGMRYRFGNFQLDTSRECVFGPEGAVALRPQTFAVLRLLVERAPALVTHAEILDAVWGHSAISETAVAQTIKELRHAFADSARAPRYIETRPRRGYRMAAPVTSEPATQAAEARQVREHEVRTAMRGSTRGARPWLRPALLSCLAVAALLLLGGTAIYVGFVSPTQPVDALTAPPDDPIARDAFETGVAALLHLDARAAIESLQRATGIAPDHVGVALAMLRAHEIAGDMVAVRESLDAIHQRHPSLTRSQQLELDAIEARLTYRWGIAVAALTALHAFHPRLSVATQLLKAQIKTGDRDAAERTLEWLRSHHANHPRTVLAAAQLAAAREQYDIQRDMAEASARWALRDGHPALAAHALRLAALAAWHGGEIDAAEALAERAQRAATEAGDARTEGAALLVLAEVASGRAALDAAESHARAARQRFATIRYAAGDAEAQRLLGLVAEQRGEIDDALAAYRQADAVLEKLGDRAGVARMQAAIGTALSRAGKTQEALLAFDRARDAHAAIGDRRGLAGAWNNRGMLLARIGQTNEARSAFERALEAFEAADDRRGQAVTLGNLAALAGRAGQDVRAIELNQRALAIFTALGADADVARLAYNLGLAEQRRGKLEQAEALLQRAASTSARLEVANQEAAAWTALGELQLRQGRPAEASAALERGRVLAVEDPMRRASLLTLAGRIAMSGDRRADARRAFEEARALREQAGASLWVHASELDLAEVALADDQRVVAEQAARRLAEAFGQAGEHADRAAALLLLGESLRMQHRIADAERAAAEAEVALQHAPDAERSLRIALLHAQVSDRPLAMERLAWVERTAAAQGFRALELRARLLALVRDGARANADAIAVLASRAQGMGLLRVARLAREARAP